MSAEVITLEGEVLRQHRGGFYVVACQLGAYRRDVLARPSGKMIQRHVRLTEGDRVRVEVGIYDPTRGRIVYRLR
jgi:translation initiation factor IF-1